VEDERGKEKKRKKEKKERKSGKFFLDELWTVMIRGRRKRCRGEEQYFF
jgi:hypothetical protein